MEDGLSRLLPLLFIAFFWLITASSRGKKKTQTPPGAGKTGAARAPGSANGSINAGTDRKTVAAAQASVQPVSPAMKPSPSAGYGYGSLGGISTEGVDPCHDDPYAIPSGSLEIHSEEGRDPCHDEWKPAAPNVPATETGTEKTGGLNLNWTGNEIVKGFVYGEILNRKVG